MARSQNMVHLSRKSNSKLKFQEIHHLASYSVSQDSLGPVGLGWVWLVMVDSITFHHQNTTDKAIHGQSRGEWALFATN